MTSRRTKPLLVLISIATMTSAPLFAKDDAREALLRGADIARFKANVTANLVELNKYLDDDLAYAHSNGAVDTKTSFIKSLSDGTRDYLSIEPKIDTVRIFGDVAVVRGTAKVTVTGTASQNNIQNFALAYTNVWLWKNGRWQMTEWRSARLPDPVAK